MTESYMRLIDANAADVENINCYYAGACRLSDVQEWLDSLPTIHPEQVRRKIRPQPQSWKVENDPEPYVCPVCGCRATYKTNYCPDCGTRLAPYNSKEYFKR